jgi:hypothetical protein
MTIQLTSIRCEKPGSYAIELQSTVTAARFAFIFSVTRAAGIDTVIWPPEFSAWMQQQVSPATPLMEAVLKFHRAQAMDFDPQDG